MSLLRTATHMAVASSVHGKVQRRQARRWAAADQTAAAQPPAPAAPPAPPAAPAPEAPAAPVAANDTDAMGRTLEQLTQLGQLKAAGILTEAEFEAKKALILAG
jgi:hypothetical protein